MIALYPVFIEKNEMFWKKSRGLKLIQQSLKNALNLPCINKVIVVSNDNEIVDCSRALIRNSFLLSDYRDNKSCGFLPAGTNALLKYVKEYLKIDEKYFIVVNFRNPLITTELLLDVIKKFKMSNSDAYISYREFSDHPCQLASYYRKEYVGLLYLLDEKFDLSYYRNKIKKNYINECEDQLYVSFPIHFDWKSSGVSDPTGFYLCNTFPLVMEYVRIKQRYILNTTQTDLRLHSFNKIDFSNEKLLTAPLLIYNSENTARVLFRLSDIQKNTEQKILGFATTDKFKCEPIFKESMSSIIEINNKNNLTEYIIDYQEFDHAGVHGNESNFLDFNETFEFPTLESRKDKISGIIYCILKNVTDGDYDIQVPFPPYTDLWYADNKTGRMRNTDTGDLIVGRQNFPDIYEPDGSVLIINRNQTLSLDYLIKDGTVGSFLLKEDDFVEVKTELDWFHYMAKKKARENKKLT